MKAKHCILKKDKKGVFFITLNRPEVHNALNDELIGELSSIFKTANGDNHVRLVVLSGNGKSFCAGADLNWMKKVVDYTLEESFKDSMKLANLFNEINNLNKPLVGIVKGVALGGGAGLAAVCDEVICTRESIFGFSEVRLGLIPAVISPYVIAKIGEGAARSTFLSGARFSAERAYELGLVHHVVEKEKLEETKENLIGAYLKAGPKSSCLAKDLIRNITSRKQTQKNLDYTCEAMTHARLSEEGQEGMKALLEKRNPNWTQ